MTAQANDWQFAARLVKPRSRLGWLFGVTQKDIDRAVAKLQRV